VRNFCPSGYVTTKEAIVEAAGHWYSGQFAACDTAAAADSSMLQPIPQFFADVALVTIHRLRDLLHGGKLTAYYFGSPFPDDRGAVHSEFWATAEADGILESGIYFPFGRPTRSFETRLN
jgi:hypothetical protein